MHRGKGHSLRGMRVVILLNVKAWESLPMSAEHEQLEILSGGRRVRGKSHARWQRGGWENTVRLCVLSLPTGKTAHMAKGHSL